jgi:hypothetical protein
MEEEEKGMQDEAVAEKEKEELPNIEEAEAR